eukprot:scaffold124921_cov59-Phaeocystis_antarctica.AAC.6
MARPPRRRDQEGRARSAEDGDGRALDAQRQQPREGSEWLFGDGPAPLEPAGTRPAFRARADLAPHEQDSSSI